jgi:hypothetical protein
MHSTDRSQVLRRFSLKTYRDIVRIYSAKSATSDRLSDSFGIFGWGFSNRSASLLASKPGAVPMVSKGGA